MHNRRWWTNGERITQYARHTQTTRRMCHRWCHLWNLIALSVQTDSCGRRSMCRNLVFGMFLFLCFICVTVNTQIIIWLTGRAHDRMRFDVRRCVRCAQCQIPWLKFRDAKWSSFCLDFMDTNDENASSQCLRVNNARTPRTHRSRQLRNLIWISLFGF